MKKLSPKGLVNKKKNNLTNNLLFINLIKTIMKKSLFFVAAASALMLTACSSENDVVQNAVQSQEAAAQQAVGFDVYMSQAVTRAGFGGVMTTEKLKTNTPNAIGFGVFAFYHNNGTYPANNTTEKPNFMFNEHVSWNNGWAYSPLKYWPNETTNDKQDPAATAADLDKLSFFAYAPYVNLTTTSTMTVNTTGPVTEPAYVEASPSDGILAISKETRQGDPLVEWKYSSDIDNNVDLLWGVAAAGMDYTSVNGNSVPAVFGMPLLNLVKPNKDQKIKFLFQHALSRIGLSVVSSIDQIAAGDDGKKFNNGETRVLIEEVKVWGDFCTQGVLNLNNTAVNKANWIEASIDKSGSLSTPGSPLYTFGNGEGGAVNAQITKDLRYISTDYVVGGGLDISTATGATDADKATNKFNALNKGVQTYETVLLTGGPDDGTKVTNPTFKFGTVLYKYNSTTKEYEIATTTANIGNIYTKDATGKYTQVKTTLDAAMTVDGSIHYYTLMVTPKTVNAGTSTNELVVGKEYYTTLTGTEGAGTAVYDGKFTATSTPADGTYYEITESDLGVTPLAAGDYWTSLLPRYMMFIPSKTDDPTKIKVEIKYHVVTYDDKLNGWISNVENDITKQTEIQLESGKSYNLKLILGLTSVKLDAVVGDWQVGDGGEVWLPQNVE